MKSLKWIKENKILLALVFLGAALRLYKLDFQSVWLDEIHTLNQSNPNNTFFEIFDFLKTHDAHPPLYYFLIHVVFILFGYTAYVMKLFSAIIGIFSIIAIYFLGKEICNKKTGLWAAFLCSLNYFCIYYSQEGRMYMLLFLMVILTLLATIKLLKNTNFKNVIFFVVTSSLMIYTHFYGLFFLLSIYIILLLKLFYLKKQESLKYLISLITIGIFTIILYIPSLVIITQNVNRESIWIQKPTLDLFKLTFEEFFGFSPQLYYFALLIMIISIYMLFFKRKLNDSKVIFLLYLTIILSILFPLIYSLVKLPIIVSRYLIFVLPSILIVLSITLSKIKNQKLNYLLIIFFLFFSLKTLIFDKRYYSTVTKTQFRDVSAFIAINNIKQEPVISSLAWYFPYFLNNDILRTTIIDKPLDVLVNEMINDSTKKQSFWYVDAHSRPLKLNNKQQNFLDNNFEIMNNVELYDTWTNHYVLKSQISNDIDISKYQPLKEKNGDNVNFWIDKFEIKTNQIDILGWAYIENQDAVFSNIQLIFIYNQKATRIKTHQVIRQDISNSIGYKFNLDNSGYSAIVFTDEFPLGEYRLGILITNQKTKKEGLVLTDKIFKKTKS